MNAYCCIVKTVIRIKYVTSKKNLCSVTLVSEVFSKKGKMRIVNNVQVVVISVVFF